MNSKCGKPKNKPSPVHHTWLDISAIPRRQLVEFFVAEQTTTLVLERGRSVWAYWVQVILWMLIPCRIQKSFAGGFQSWCFNTFNMRNACWMWHELIGPDTAQHDSMRHYIVLGSLLEISRWAWDAGEGPQVSRKTNISPAPSAPISHLPMSPQNELSQFILCSLPAFARCLRMSEILRRCATDLETLATGQDWDIGLQNARISK